MRRPIKRRLLFIVIFVLFGSTNCERRFPADGVRRTPERGERLGCYGGWRRVGRRPWHVKWWGGSDFPGFFCLLCAVVILNMAVFSRKLALPGGDCPGL